MEIAAFEKFLTDKIKVGGKTGEHFCRKKVQGCWVLSVDHVLLTWLLLQVAAGCWLRGCGSNEAAARRLAAERRGGAAAARPNGTAAACSLEPGAWTVESNHSRQQQAAVWRFGARDVGRWWWQPRASSGCSMGRAT